MSLDKKVRSFPFRTNFRKYLNIAVLCTGIFSGCGLNSDNNRNAYNFSSDNSPEEIYVASDNAQEIIIKDSNNPKDCKKRYFQDRDGDGYGDMTTYICEPLPGYVEDNSDCDDNDYNINPSAEENPCDNKDNDCNDKVDENLISHYMKTCSNNNSYWQDNCENINDLIEACNNGYCDNGECFCEPNCNGKECGDNGCGGSCGDCKSPIHCSSGHCYCDSSCPLNICTISYTFPTGTCLSGEVCYMHGSLEDFICCPISKKEIHSEYCCPENTTYKISPKLIPDCVKATLPTMWK